MVLLCCKWSLWRSVEGVQLLRLANRLEDGHGVGREYGYDRECCLFFRELARVRTQTLAGDGDETEGRM